jgi:PAS domain S-box-containing protein
MGSAVAFSEPNRDNMKSMSNMTIMIVLGAVMVAALLLVTAAQLRRRRNAAASKNRLVSELHNEETKTNIILNGINDGVVVIDNQQLIQFFNPGAEAITGWSSAEADGLSYKSALKLVDDKGQAYDDLHDPISRLLKEGKPIHDNQANLLSKSNKTLAVDLSISPLIDDKKRISGAVVILRDVSEARQQEHQQVEFISTASHEMRTPVAAIEGYIALAMNDKVSTVDSRARGYLEKAHESTQHLGQLFQDLLTSAKAEDGRLSNHPAVVELGALLEQLVSDLKFAAEKKGLGMEYSMGGNHTIDASKGHTVSKVVQPLFFTYVDPERLREVITNLFDNAIKYTDNGKITIGLTGDDKLIQFYIRDTGHGIPAEDIPHLFQKFYRVDNSATRTVGGTGLGLFICRKIIELYQGRIWVASELGKGSTFYINLPRLSPQKAEQLKAEEALHLKPTAITPLEPSVVQ